MRLHLFILLLLTSLCFGVDFNAKTEENRAKIMEFSANHYTRDATFEKYKNNLWFKDEEFLRELLKNTYRYNLDDIMKCIDNKNILNDKEVFLQWAKKENNSDLLKIASETIKNDKEFMLNILDLSADSVKYASDRLKDDKDYVLKFIQNHGNYLEYASERLRDNREIVLKAVQSHYGYALKYASERLKNDREVVFKAIEKTNIALMYAGERVRDDKEIVFEGVLGCAKCISYASERLKNDREFIFKIAKKNTSVLAYVNKSILKEKEIVLYYLNELEKYNKRLKRFGVKDYKIVIDYSKDERHSIFKKISPHLLDDEEVMFKAVSVFGTFLQYASQRMKKDKNIIIAALKNNPKAHQYIPCKMRQDKDVLKILMNQNINGYMQNKIKRKVKPQAWESYDINETLEILYGKDRIYETSEDIHVKLPRFMLDDNNFFRLNTNKKVKSIAILQKKEGNRALVALYYTYGNIANITLPLKILNNYTNDTIKGMRVVVITETEDNHLFINEYTTNHEYVCMNGENPMDDHFKWLKNNLNTNIWRRKRYGIDEKGIGYVKLVFSNPMLSYEEAEKLNTKVNFIAHISGRIQDKKLFDLYTSEYIYEDPFIMMKFENMKQDEGIELSYTTINGKVKTKYAKPRKMKKKSH